MPGLHEEDEGLAPSLLPLLLHEISGSAQYATSLSGLLAHGGTWTGRLAGAFDEFRQDVRDQGYLLGLLGAELGADLFRARREPRALKPLVGLVGRALRRQGRDLAPCPEGLPLIRGFDERGSWEGGGWEVAWGLATWLLAGGLAQPPQSSLQWSLVRSPQAWTLVLSRLVQLERLQRAQERIGARLRSVRFEVATDSAALILPSEWLSMEG